MKRYFKISPHGWGLINARFFDESDNTYVSHNDDVVVFHEPSVDFWEWEDATDVEYSRNFELVRNQLLADHKRRIAELLKDVEILESSTNYEQYCENFIKMRTL